MAWQGGQDRVQAFGAGEETVSADVRRGQELWFVGCGASAAGHAGGSVETSCYPGAIDRCLRGFTWQDS